ncbi:peptide-binding protein [Chitinophaga sp. GCM10012297]|uniref:PDZ domain-containing protein n=1 Tax=Chitinophaga chungangae TaxID=2821488 RepID=A0ABS3YIN3_9BACT|nr:PDZ domain-containing protein [Chitinophaga chungangae]MBO9154548.1 PDZ domain-containing protein [Chitinophaga chungangae]
MLKWLLTGCMLLALHAPGRTQTRQIYLSPAGNDNYPGTKEKPMATLQAAQQRWRQLRAQRADQPVTVILQNGTYHPEQTLVLTPEDGSLTITALAGQKAVISGARPLEVKWKAGADGIYAASVPAAVRQMDRLYMNGETQVLARYPNYDSTARFYHGTSADALSPERIKTWKHPRGGIVHALHRAEWGGYHYIITGVDSAGNAVLEGGWQNNRQMGLHAQHRFVENIREELDAPREWFFDAEKHMLYYKPQAGQVPPSHIEYASLSELIVIKGTETKPVKNVTLRDLQFTGTVRTFMLTKEPLLRSDWTIYRGGAVLVEGAEDCDISHCFFNETGGNAVFVNNYNRRVDISGCHIYKAGASGIAFVGNPEAVRSPAFEYNHFVPYAEMDFTKGPKNNDYPKDCAAADNLIQYTGETEKQSAGVQISMSSQIRVAYNTIHDLPRAGINISEGTWGGHLLEHNEVYNTVLETGDHGAFNSWGRDRFWHPNRRTMDSATTANINIVLLDAVETTVIRNNRFRCDHGWDIDLDDGSGNYHIYNNVCLNGGLKLREGFFRTVENNILLNNSFHPHVWFLNSGDIFRHNIVTASYKPIQVKKWGEKVDSNFFPDEAALKAAQVNGTDAHSLSGDPQFIDFKNGDYGVKPGSGALKAGFVNFPMNGFGTRIQSLRDKAAPVPLPPALFSQQSGPQASISWKGATVKNIEGLGERSATGLPDEKGAYFVTVPAGSEAEKMGFRTGDVLLQLDGEKVNNIKDFLGIYQPNAWRGRLKATVFRNQQSTAITLSK